MGGIQRIFCGDFLQLPPIGNSDSGDIGQSPILADVQHVCTSQSTIKTGEQILSLIMQRYPYQVYFFHLLTLCNCSYSLYPSTISAVLIHEKPYEGVTIFSTYKNRDRVTHLCGQGVVLLRIIAVNSEGLTMTFTVYSCYNFVLHQKSFICTFFTPYITKIILFSNEVPGIGS